MSLHQDLLAQATHLATKERKRPKQASLRRAVSVAYYAVFHLFVDDVTRFVVSGAQRGALRKQLARCMEHAHMRDACRAFANSQKSSNAWRNVSAQAPSKALQSVAQAFVDLQQDRHDADYNLAVTFTRSQVLATITNAQHTFTTWATVRDTPEGAAFMLALLVRSRA